MVEDDHITSAVHECILFIALIMEAASTSEMLVNFYQTTQHNIPENNHLRTLLIQTTSQHRLTTYKLQLSAIRWQCSTMHIVLLSQTKNERMEEVLTQSVRRYTIPSSLFPSQSSLLIKKHE
jgi:hypothetical protein